MWTQCDEAGKCSVDRQMGVVVASETSRGRLCILCEQMSGGRGVNKLDVGGTGREPYPSA